MSLFGRLFGGGGGGKAAAGAPAETYQGFAITPEPANEGGGWRIGARIEKEIGGEMKVHHLVRADTIQGQEAAAAASIAKARQLIDEQGERLFD